MSNIAHYHFTPADLGLYFQQAATELGTTPLQLWESGFDLRQALVSLNLAQGQLTASFRGGASMNMRYDPATMTVTQIELYHQGQLFYEWSGAMSGKEFLCSSWPDWPKDIAYGNPEANLLSVRQNATVYADSGNDVIQMEDNAAAFGQAGQDVFALEHVNDGGQLRIADYELGERIYFSMYESMEELGAAFQGVSDVTANRFTLHFAQQYGLHWSLTIEGVGLNEFAAQQNFLGGIVLVGVEGGNAVYGPVMQAMGLL